MALFPEEKETVNRCRRFSVAPISRPGVEETHGPVGPAAPQHSLPFCFSTALRCVSDLSLPAKFSHSKPG